MSTLEEKLVQDFKLLPKERQKEVIDFVEFLKSKEDRAIENIMDRIITENKEALEELGK